MLEGTEECTNRAFPTWQVVIESDLYTHQPLELLPHRGDRRDPVDGRRFGRLQTGRPPTAHPAKALARPDPRTSLGSGNHSEPPTRPGQGNVSSGCGLSRTR
ncbi:hypothetical protein P7K49_027119 [Saguinus oedipus]|uniref:Vexin n=1 Tax=Saguinus oedipus TaxID=9490 RepID=A0ABQ9UF54_SAGOE|nr:hypothetical protein P7K49_027119 [Saguinus oedipus]